MAVYNALLQSPVQFHSILIVQMNGLRKWHHQFEQFCVILRLSKEDEERQITTLLDCLGKYANDVLTSTNISKE